MSKVARWRVEGRDMTPDGYHDQLLYEGNSVREVWRAYRSARRNEMQVCVTRRWP
ncbi:hypothetical protein Jolie1_047 [Mycobacterium phage Julie1]|uniref:Uncharacterized protein n=1 Tax=Mycobacterium phage Julie1 TaxID=1463812 RepID=W8EB63_9CAUD|nr:hypothetical protein CG90_gp47 [Mycobacterium phage Julie1]YP_009009603.1 hypothetical protein CG91_gp046 [Mycobacterium phage 39HC]YP_009032271.1 hypothetical protein FH38_gp45 [Mycobacterium phage Hosp]AHJ88446.1 hypothetical protein 40BC_046 [Mycobacterium phage 40BC]AHJ88346.1 hypothetical protein 39HC_046 [Mycobacterium phage 39HC]AHJ88547.1 hypothetical protein Jolie1_047 [Mycobacterium phage Julie1]AHK11999.1 hypothetical protein Hosp_045 [Mycobacterium phage Hosp]